MFCLFCHIYNTIGLFVPKNLYDDGQRKTLIMCLIEGESSVRREDLRHERRLRQNVASLLGKSADSAETIGVPPFPAEADGVFFRASCPLGGCRSGGG